jgi:type I restriction enzyme S subunit
MRKRYDSYKDSGVEWIGEIPSHWGCGFMKYQLSNNDGGVWGKDVENEDEGTIVIRSTEITIDGNWDFSNPMKRKLSDSEVQKTLLFRGDIVLTKSSGSPEHIGKSVIVTPEVEDLKCCYSNFVQRLRFEKYNPKLYHYILNNYVVREQYRFLTQSTTGLGNLNGTTLNEIQLPFIPLSEQQQIVSFLDTKTSLIDSLIEKTKLKIQLLKEKRTSLINEVVTKGLNPNVEMKHSGVDWIGEIPSSWLLKKIGYVSKLLTGNPWKSDLFDFESGIKIVRGENVSEGFLRWGSRTRFWKEEVEENSIFYLKEGDIIVGMDGSKVGKNFVRINKVDLPLLLHQRMCRIRVYEGYESKFIEYWIGSEMFRFYIDISKTDPMIPHITQKNIFDFKVPFPSFSEQQQIVSYLDEQTQLIDKTISIEEKRIELLKEYRQSLISEVVTGKIKVI